MSRDTSQGPTGPVLSSGTPLPPAGCLGTCRTCDVVSEPPAFHCSGTSWTSDFVSGPTSASLLLLRVPLYLFCHLGTSVLIHSLFRDLQVLCCRLGIHCPLQPAQGPTGPVLSPPDPLPPACHCSGARWTCGVIWELPACCCSGTCRTCDVLGHPVLSLPLLGDPQDLWCCQRIQCLMPATAQGTA